MFPILVGMILFAILAYFEGKKRSKRKKEYEKFDKGFATKRKRLYD